MTYITEPNTLAKKDDSVRAEPEDDDAEAKRFDQNPVRAVCPHCGLSVITYIEHESSWVTYLVSVVLLLVLQWAALCVVPVVFPLFKDVVHHCPRCLSVLAVRSRVELPSFRQDVMTFRFGSCVIVLARKWVILLMCLTGLIFCIHGARGPGSTPSGIDAVVRGESAPLTWDEFVKDCGLKSYLGNPIHVNIAFDEKYKNRTFHWSGTVHHVEEGLNFLWWSAKGAVFVRMSPPQFANWNRKDMADLVLFYDESEPIGKEAIKLKRDHPINFEATFVEVGKRGAPHVMLAWEVHLEEKGKEHTAPPTRADESLPQTVVAAQALANATVEGAV